MFSPEYFCPNHQRFARKISKICATEGLQPMTRTPMTGDHCVYYPSNSFRNTRGFENWGISLGYSPGGIFSHVLRLDHNNNNNNNFIKESVIVTKGGLTNCARAQIFDG